MRSPRNVRIIAATGRPGEGITGAGASLFHDVAHQPFGTDFRAIDDAVLVRGDAFRRAGGDRLVHGIGDEVFDGSILGAADAHAALPAVMVLRYRFRFGIGDIDHVVLVDIDAAGTTELRPGFQELDVLVENIDEIVVAVADEQPAARIHS